MKMSDIITGQDYYISKNAFGQGYVRGGEEIIGEIVATRVAPYNDGRRDHVSVIIKNESVREGKRAYKEDPDKPIDISARYVEVSVGEVERRLQEAEQEREAKAKLDEERLREIGQMADPLIIGHHVMAVGYNPGDPAYELVKALDNMVEQATKIKKSIEDNMAGERHGRSSHPKRRDGARVFHSLSSEIGWLNSAERNVHERLMRYEAHTAVYNLLSNSGVDFEKAMEIRHPKVKS